MDSSILTFANHGCRGKYNIGQEAEFNEFTVDPKVMPEEVIGKKSAKFSPMIDRHLFHFPIRSLKHIPAGHELLDNYLFFTSEDGWEAYVTALRNECSGAPGHVVNYESERKQ